MTNLNTHTARTNTRALTGMVQRMANRIFARWLQRSTARHAWRPHMPVLNST